MEGTGIHPELAQQRDAALSEVGQQYCQHLVNSLISPHLDTSKAEINSNLLRVFGEVLTNVENRVKVVFERSMQSGEATAAEPEKCVAEFQKRLHYMEDYLSTCFQSRNVSYLYGKMEGEEPATSGPQYRTAQRAMARIRRQLQEELDVQSSVLLDGLVQHKLVRDWEKDSILARPTPRAKAEELLRVVTPRLDQTGLQQQFLPLLRQDHEHLAEALSKALEEEEETLGSEIKCCVCQFKEGVEVKRLARHLSEVVSPSLDSDLSSLTMPNNIKMQRLKEEVSPEQVIESLREPYPALHQQFCSERVTALECFCARLREAPTSDFVEGLGTFSVTDDGDLAQMSDLQSILGDLDLKERAYHLGSKTPGICLIINNITYNYEGKTFRRGSESDSKKLSELFTRLHFSVVVYQDLVAKEMENRLKEVAGRDHSQYDCFVCFILSIGCPTDQLFGIDGSTISMKDVIQIFHANKCPSLAGKPKLLFIEASRGGDVPAALVPESAEDGLCADAADIFIGYSCSENHHSFRNSTQGAWYINALVEVLSKYGEQYDFQTCMTMATQLMASRVAHVQSLDLRRCCQIPQSVSTLRKPLFLSQNPVVTRPAPKFVQLIDSFRL